MDRAQTNSESTFDLAEMYRQIVDAMHALWAPSEAQIEDAGTRFVSFLYSLGGPLVQATSVKQFDALFEYLAVPGAVGTYQRLTSTSAFAVWAKRIHQRTKVKELYPSAAPTNAELTAWRDDVRERLRLLEPILTAARKMKGAHHPKKAIFEAVAAKLLVACISLEMSASPTSKVLPEIAEQAWKRCCDSIRQFGHFYGIQEARYLPSNAPKSVPAPLERAPDDSGTLDRDDLASAIYRKRLDDLHQNIADAAYFDD